MSQSSTLDSPSLVQCEPNPFPSRIITGWRRFSGGLWRVPEGDIEVAYSAEAFPNVKTFIHEGRLYTNTGCHFGPLILATADCYPLLPMDGYTGPDPRRYSYEGKEAIWKSKRFRLGPKVLFTAYDPTSDEWQMLLRVIYADGGYFAARCSYQEFLAERFAPDSPNGRAAHAQELAKCEARPMPRTQDEMKSLLEQRTVSDICAKQPRQIEFAL